MKNAQRQEGGLGHEINSHSQIPKIYQQFRRFIYCIALRTYDIEF